MGRRWALTPFSTPVRFLPIVISHKHEGPDVSRRGPLDALVRRSLLCGSERANVLRLRALGALRDVELDLLVLVQGLVALALDGRVVHEDVVAAVLLRNEAEALLGVEPLDSALSHAHLLLIRGVEPPPRRPRDRCGETPSPLEKLVSNSRENADRITNSARRTCWNLHLLRR